jgi:NAD(P)-dependent dehydrogenase (short-subunit alcohol dehydrogenase family)
MKKELLIFGSEGALGSGVSKVLTSKDFDQIHLFDFKFKDPHGDDKIKKHIINDLSGEDNVKEAFAKVKPDKNTAFFLFSTVGGFAGGSKIWESDVEEWNKMMQMNFNASYQIAKHFSLLVKDSHSGSICLTAAYTGLFPEEGKAAYGTSKAALVYFVKTLAAEGKAINLSANAIAPYIIDTLSNREWMQDANYDSWMKPEEIAELIHLLFSNYYFVTGNIIKLTHRFSIL